MATFQKLLTEAATETEPLAAEPRAEAAMLAAAELPELKAVEPLVTRVPAAAMPAVKTVAATM